MAPWWTKQHPCRVDPHQDSQNPFFFQSPFQDQALFHGQIFPYRWSTKQSHSHRLFLHDALRYGCNDSSFLSEKFLPVSVSELGQGVPGIHCFHSSSLHWTRSGEVSWPLCRWLDPVSVEPDCQFLQVCSFISCQSHMSRHPLGGILNAELSAWQGRDAGPGSSGLDQLCRGLVGLTGSRWRWRYFPFVSHSLTGALQLCKWPVFQLDNWSTEGH